MEKSQIKTILRIIDYLIIYLFIASLGFILGMVYQQIIFTGEISKILSYSDVEVNIVLNETKLIEELNNSFIPAWKQSFNETIQNKLEDKK